MQCRQGKGLVLNCECQFPTDKGTDKFPWKKFKTYKQNTFLNSPNFLLNNKISLKRRNNQLIASTKCPPSKQINCLKKSPQKNNLLESKKVAGRTIHIHYPMTTIQNHVSEQIISEKVKTTHDKSQNKILTTSYPLYPQRSTNERNMHGYINLHNYKTSQKPTNQFDKEKDNLQTSIKNNSMILMIPKQSIITALTDSYNGHHKNISSRNQLKMVTPPQAKEMKKKKSCSIRIESNEERKRPISMGKFQQIKGMGQKLEDLGVFEELESVVDEGSEYSQVVMSYGKMLVDKELQPFQLTNLKLLTENDH